MLTTRDVVHVALFAAIIAVLGLIPKIQLAAGVPITAQSLGVMLAGGILGRPRPASESVRWFFAGVPGRRFRHRLPGGKALAET